MRIMLTGGAVRIKVRQNLLDPSNDIDHLFSFLLTIHMLHCIRTFFVFPSSESASILLSTGLFNIVVIVVSLPAVSFRLFCISVYCHTVVLS